MPQVLVDTSSLRSTNSKTVDSSNGPLIFTPFGYSLLEIQGELNVPSRIPVSQEGYEQEYLSNFVKVDDIYEAVKFGNLEFNKNSEKSVTLFIGKSQRLIGEVVDLETPLGILRITKNEDNEQNKKKGEIKMIDIIRKKIIFKQRPLPIM